MPPTPPTELASSTKFTVLGKIGEGGMGSIWKARHAFLDSLVAIKVMSPAVAANPDARERFLQEMRAAGKLQHKHIVRAIDAEVLGDTLILVMEYVEGVTLHDLVKQKGKLRLDLACRLVSQAAEGLQHAHEQGMVHRDIKPSNLMITRAEREVKILDFGLARLTREAGPKRNLTQTQMFMGTPDYVSPEQATNARHVDIRADLYSLGCTLYFLLTGKPPFEREEALNVIIAHIQDEPPPLRDRRPDVPEGLAAVVARMMAKEPANRYATPAEVVAALEPFVTRRTDGGSVEVHSSATTVPPPRRTPPPVPPPLPPVEEPVKRGISPAVLYGGAALAGLLTTVVAVAGFLLMTGEPPEKAKPPEPPATPMVVVQIDQPDARLTLDGKRLDLPVPGDMRPVQLAVSDDKEHTLKVEKDGYEPATVPVRHRGISTPAVQVRLVKLPPPIDYLDKALVAGSVWQGRDARLAVLSRIAEAITARLDARHHKRLVAGTIKDGRLTWKASDVKVLQGDAGQDGEGKLGPGDVLQLRLGDDVQLRRVRLPGGSDPPAVEVATAHRDRLPAGFIHLFNGTNLAGWKVPDAKSWRVEEGTLVGIAGAQPTSLFTDRTYKNFHLLAEAKVSADGNSGLLFRTDAEVDLSGTAGAVRVGEQARGGAGTAVEPDAWVSIEVIAFGPDVVTRVNGQTVAQAKLDDKTTAAPLGLQLVHPGTFVTFRKIAVRELPETLARFPARLLDGWRVEATELVPTAAGADTALLFGERSWTDYDLKAEVQTQGTPFALYARHASDTYGVQCVVGDGGKPVAELWPIGSGDKKAVAKLPAALVPGKWVSAVLRVRGRNVELVLDGEPVLTATVPSHLTGSVGLRAPRGRVRFRDVQVTTPGGKLLAGGLPEPPPPPALEDAAVTKLTETKQLTDFTQPIRAVGFVPGKRSFHVCEFANGSGRQSVWDTTGKRLGQRPRQDVRAFAISSRNIVASWGGGSPEVQLWRATDPKFTTLETLRPFNDGEVTMRFSLDGTQLLVCNRATEELVTYQVGTVTRERGRRTPQGSPVTATPKQVAIAPDHKAVSAGWDSGVVRTWDAATGKQLKSFAGHPGGVTAILYSPDGKRLLTGGGDGDVRVWDVDTGKEVAHLQGHRQAVTCLMLSPNGKRLYTGGRDGVIGYWDLETAKPLHRLTGHGGPVTCLTQSFDGGTIVSGGDDRTVRFWAEPKGG